MKSLMRNELKMQYKNTKVISLNDKTGNPEKPIKQIMNTIRIFITIEIIKNLLGLDDQKCLFSLTLNNEKQPMNIRNAKIKVCNFEIWFKTPKKRFPKYNNPNPSIIINIPIINPKIISRRIFHVSGLLGYSTLSVAMDRVT